MIDALEKLAVGHADGLFQHYQNLETTSTGGWTAARCADAEYCVSTIPLPVLNGVQKDVSQRRVLLNWRVRHGACSTLIARRDTLESRIFR